MIPEQLQQPEEIAELVRIYRLQDPVRVLEIGTHAGGTLYEWARFASAGTTIVSVDLGVHEEYQQNKPYFAEWLPPAVDLLLYEGDSTSEGTQDWVRQHGPYDFIFIDGNHVYNYVKSDWELAKEVAAKDAIVAFHDIRAHGGPWGIEVNQVWEEVRRNFKTEEIVADLKPEECVFGWPQGIGVVYL